MFRWLFWTRVCVFMIRTPSTNTWSNTSRNLKCGLMKGNYFLCRPTGWVKFSLQAICREETLALGTFSFIRLSPSQCTSIWSNITHRRPRVCVSEVVSLQSGHPFKTWIKTVLIQDVHFQGNLKGMFWNKCTFTLKWHLRFILTLYWKWKLANLNTNSDLAPRSLSAHESLCS
jgi:hypothetical protein